MTQAAPTNLLAGMVSVVLLLRSLPVIQCTGASKCVPVCSPSRIVFQYQAGPLSSYFEMRSTLKGGALAGDDPWDIWCGNGWILRRRGPGPIRFESLEAIQNLVQREVQVAIQQLEQRGPR